MLLNQNVYRIYVSLLLVAGFALLTLNHYCVDHYVNLDVARRLLEGQHMYKDIIMANMPFQYYFQVPAAAIYKYLNVPLTYASRGYALFMLGASGLLAFNLFKQVIQKTLGDDPKYLRSLQLLLIFIALVFPFTMNNQFGQKEHFISMFVLPYVALLSSDILNIQVSRTRRVFSIFFLLLACAIKPFYFGLAAISELYLTYHRRKITFFRAESLTVVGWFALLSLFMVFLFPHYATKITPLVKFYFWYFRMSIEAHWNTFFYFLVYLIPVAVSWRLLLKTPLLQYFVLVLGALAFAPVVQFKGWAYHFMPSAAFGFFLLIMLLFFIQKEKRSGVVAQRITMVALAALLLANISGIRVEGERQPEVMQQLRNLARQYDKPRFYFVTPEITYMPMVEFETEASSVSDFYHFWIITGLRQYEHKHPGYDAVYEKEKQQIVRTIIDDIEQKDPDVLLIDSPNFDKEGVIHEVQSYDLLNSDPKFAEIMRRYVKLKPITDSDPKQEYLLVFEKQGIAHKKTAP